MRLRQSHEQPRPDAVSKERRPSKTRLQAFALFAKGKSLDDVRQATGRAASTVLEYLVDYIEREELRDPHPWLDSRLFDRIRSIAERTDSALLKPIFEALDGTVDYDQIRIAVACLRNAGRVPADSPVPADKEAG